MLPHLMGRPTPRQQLEDQPPIAENSYDGRGVTSDADTPTDLGELPTLGAASESTNLCRAAIPEDGMSRSEGQGLPA